jgi:hypothetical protein
MKNKRKVLGSFVFGVAVFFGKFDSFAKIREGQQYE